MIFIGIDNGVSGSIAALNELGKVELFQPTPVKKCLNYTKKKSWINRIDHMLFGSLIEKMNGVVLCALERPMVNPGRFQATVSAVRALESTQIILELLQIPFVFVDSREWQKELLPSGLHKEELKHASNEVCKRMFPSADVKMLGGGDSLLIAEWARRKYAKTQG